MKNIKNFEEFLNESLNSLGKNPTTAEVAKYVWDNWKKITGLRDSDRDEEGHFPDEVDDILDKYGIDYDDFSDEWGYLGEGRVTEGFVAKYKRSNAEKAKMEEMLQKLKRLVGGSCKVVFNKYDGYGLEVEMSGYYRNGEHESDGSYYSYTWNVNDEGSAMYNAFEDERMRYEITNGFWDEENIHTVEDFANAILGKLKGQWV